jgi:hypothetical protein
MTTAHRRHDHLEGGVETRIEAAMTVGKDD